MKKFLMIASGGLAAAALMVTLGIQSAPEAQAGSPTKNCRQAVMDKCCKRVTGDMECGGNAAAIGTCGREADAKCN